jgi:hypothetical protein
LKSLGECLAFDVLPNVKRRIGVYARFVDSQKNFEILYAVRPAKPLLKLVQFLHALEDHNGDIPFQSVIAAEVNVSRGSLAQPPGNLVLVLSMEKLPDLPQFGI